MCKTQNKVNDLRIIHLEMWIDDLRKKVNAEEGYPKFALTKQKMTLELELKELKIKRSSK